MTPLDWIALAALAIQLPIPFFWLIVHPFLPFWKQRPQTVYRVVGPATWLAVAALLVMFQEPLIAGAEPPLWAAAAGLALIFFDVALLLYLHNVFSGPRLYGQAELAADTELFATGIYGRVRHPRYAGMMASVAGACLVGWTPQLAVLGAAWLALALAAIHMEEKELEARFGEAYREYARRVPRFFPSLLRSTKKSG